jgi:hypothetical protein
MPCPAAGAVGGDGVKAADSASRGMGPLLSCQGGCGQQQPQGGNTTSLHAPLGGIDRMSPFYPVSHLLAASDVSIALADRVADALLCTSAALSEAPTRHVDTHEHKLIHLT